MLSSCYFLPEIHKGELLNRMLHERELDNHVIKEILQTGIGGSVCFRFGLGVPRTVNCISIPAFMLHF